MRAVEDTHLAKQDYRYPIALALQDLSTEYFEQRFDVFPGDVRAGWTRKDRFERALTTAPHAEMAPCTGTIQREIP
jgi:hypothetical protein